MKKKIGLIFASVALCAAATVGGTTFVVAENAEKVESEVKSYKLYASDTLVSTMGGKKFTPVVNSEAKITTTSKVGIYEVGKVAQPKTDAEGTEIPQMNLWSDSAYDYNVGNITSLDGTTNYQMFSYSEIFFEGFTGGFIGEEWELAEAIDVADYSSISVKVAYGEFGVAPNALQGSDHEGEALILAYGKDAEGNEKTVEASMTYGIHYWSTGVVELDTAEIATVERIAVLAGTNTIDNQGAGYICFADFTVSAREQAAEKDLLANEMGMQFYNGNSIYGGFGGTSMRVYHANDGYAWPGEWVDGSNEYVYATQRMSMGSFVTLMFNEPVKVSDYPYLDLEVKSIAQGADGAYLAETATEFTYSVLKYNATTTDSDVQFTVSNWTWGVFRIPLAEFADGNGYVSSLVIRYADNNRERAAEESVYTINTAFHNALLTSEDYDYTNCNLISQYSGIEKIGVTLGDDLSLRFTAKIGEDWANIGASFTFDGETMGRGDVQHGEAVYIFDEISPKNIADEVTFTITMSGSKLLKDKAPNATVTKSYSVKEYCEAVLDMDAAALGMSEEKFTKLQALAADILNYGAAAQEYANYNVENLANADLSEEDKAKATAFDDSLIGTYSNSKSVDEKIYVAGARLWLGATVDVEFMVAVDAAVTGSVKAQVKLGDGSWTDAGELQVGTTCIKVVGLTAADLSKSVSVRILVDGAESGAVCEYSVYRYIANKCNETDEQGDLTANAKLARALQSYAQSADAYKNER